MKSIKALYLTIVVCCLIIMACKNNNQIPEENTDNESPLFLTDYLGKKITADFKGIVIDENKIPIKGVIVSIDNKTALSDSLGNFKIKNANVNSDFAYIKAEKKDYRDSVISKTPNDSINEVTIVLHKESEPCLFWFCKRNHNLPKSDN